MSCGGGIAMEGGDWGCGSREGGGCVGEIGQL